MQKISVFITFFIAIGLNISCTRDIAPEITCSGVASYDANVKVIIDTYCAYVQCHDGSPNAPGVFLDYDGLSPNLLNGLFEQRVVNAQDMPPNNASGPITIVQEDFDLIICWIEEGFPEN